MTTELPPNGARVRFRDRGNVDPAADRVVVAEGIVNGSPRVVHEGSRRRIVWYVPVFVTERPGGRESKTIFVAETNILEVLPS